MSTYHDYNTTVGVYDAFRNAVGSDIMVAMIQLHCGKPLKELHVLDAGCGTGNYTNAFLDYGVGRITLLDSSSAMLEKAREKLSVYLSARRIHDIVEAILPPMPFSAETFDAVVFNLVLHHLEDTTEDRNFTKTIDALKEARRVLNPNGLVIISAVMPSTIRQYTWFTQILPELSEKYIQMCPTFEEYDKIFESVGLRCIQKMNILGSDILNDYHNYEGPLDENWRRGNSYWTLATDDDLQIIEEFLMNLKAKGELENWARKHDHINTAGHLTVFILSNEQKHEFGSTCR